MPGRRADEVEAPVDAVGAVDIGATRRPEHHRVARRVAGVAVRCRVVLVVGLGLDDRPADAVDEHARADQRARDLERRGGEVDPHRPKIRKARPPPTPRDARVDRIRASAGPLSSSPIPARSSLSTCSQARPDGVRRPRRLARARRDDDAPGAMVRAQVRRRHERGGGARHRRLPQLQRFLHPRAEGRRTAARRCRPGLPGRRHDQPVRPHRARPDPAGQGPPLLDDRAGRRRSRLAAHFHDGSFATST